jgi:hypothetical protein
LLFFLFPDSLTLNGKGFLCFFGGELSAMTLRSRDRIVIVATVNCQKSLACRVILLQVLLIYLRILYVWMIYVFRSTTCNSFPLLVSLISAEIPYNLRAVRQLYVVNWRINIRGVLIWSLNFLGFICYKLISPLSHQINLRFIQNKGYWYSVT